MVQTARICESKLEPMIPVFIIMMHECVMCKHIQITEIFLRGNSKS